MSNYPHIQFQFTESGTAYSDPNRRPRPSALSLQNKSNPVGHGGKLKKSLSSIVSTWQETQEKRRKNGFPDIPNFPSLLLKVDPQSFDADSLKSFGIEVILELEDGYILGASVDTDLTKLQEKIETFIAKEYGAGKVAEIWEILEGKFKRLEYILSPDLLHNWDRILDEQIYTVEISVACVGLNSKFSDYPDQRQDETPERYSSRVSRWTDRRDQTLQEWEALQLARENDFENFVVREIGGKLALLDSQ